MSEHNLAEGAKSSPGFIARIIIRFVRIYQMVAPAVVRERCRFNPSCSGYALLALEKYPIFPALKKIAGRLHRCRYPNGGIDYP